jgi:5-formyltetrahydrofolate cyclo-ligase
MNVNAWRRQQRAHLIARRLALSAEERRTADRRVAELLAGGFPMLEGLTIGFYWPFNGEVDPRLAVHRLRNRGARTALPVVVQRRAPLEFRSWAPGTATLPGVFGLPVPQSAAVIPDVLLMPPVGFDREGYRLGYGGGYFDRTLAVLHPQPLKIGLAREMSRMETIRPQPHDVPMDFVITEAAIHVAGREGLRAEHDLQAVADRAQAIREERRMLGRVELAALLNTLLEAERAGAKVVAAFLAELTLEGEAGAKLLAIQRDESANCVILAGLLRHIDATPSRATGDFLEAALAVRGDHERLAFLNRGQRWVARRIAAALPQIADPRVRAELQAMRQSHEENVAVCERLLGTEPAH